jgi:transcriptional regulator with XRE-family HTH domain
MLSLEQIKTALEDRNLITVSQRIYVSPATLRRIKNGETKPSYETLKKLSDYLEAPIDAP